MGKIVAIGGGENGRKGTVYETGPSDREIIRLTNKTNPQFLFIGLANSYPDGYYEVMKNIYHDLYKCPTDHLTLADIKNFSVANEKIKKADIIYVGSGNTLKLMNLLRKYSVDKLLIKAFEEPKVLCGISAGGICWFRYGNSDSRKTRNGAQIRVKGLDLVPALFCPHYNRDPFRQDSLKDMMKRTSKIPAIALDMAALVIEDDQYRIISLEKEPVAQKQYWMNGEYHITDLLNGKNFDLEIH